MQFTPVIKCIAGDQYNCRKHKALGINHVAESRLDNIISIADQDLTYTLLRTPAKEISDMIEKVDMSIKQNYLPYIK